LTLRRRFLGNSLRMHAEVQPAFVSREAPLEITVNFGVLAGRDVERKEIETLAEQLSPLVSGVTVIGGHRYEFAVGAAEVSASEVTARFDDFLLPTDRAEREAFVDELVATINQWARAAAATAPAAGEDLASRIARETAHKNLER
jgi:hypothetical protein